MATETTEQVLAGNGYPGHGILLGKTSDGAYALTAYFTTGRGENSRNRVFVREGDGLRTQAFNPSKSSDPSLITYAPMRMIGAKVIVTDGDQTDTVHDFLCRGETFEGTLRSHTFELDKPNFVPHVSGWMNASTDFAYRLSILKDAGGGPSSVWHMFFEYETPVPEQGHLIHTYRCDGGSIPSFEDEPVCVSVPQELEEFIQSVWNSLSTENRVPLPTRRIHLSNGEAETRIVNKNQ